MGDRRRSSLLDQMAMVAESQQLIDFDDISDDDNEDDDRFREDLEDDIIEEEDEEEELEDDDDDDFVRDDDFVDEDDGMDVQTDDEDGEAIEALLYKAADAYGGNVSRAIVVGGGGGGIAVGPLRSSGTGEDVLSHVGSEDLDEFEELDNPMPLEYGRLTAGRMAAPGFDDSAVSDFHMSSSSDNWNGPTSSDANGSGRDFANADFRASSLLAPIGAGEPGLSNTPFVRRDSYHSAPSRHDAATAALMYGDPTSGGTPVAGGRAERRRPLSISVPSAHVQEMTRRKSASVRRPSFKSVAIPDSGATTNSNEDNDTVGNNTTGSGSGILGSIRGRRRSTRRANMSISAKGSSVFGNLDNAIESLRKQDSNNEWENVAAAAAVVAAGSAGGQSKKSYVQFAVNETVLVFLTLLNVTNMEDPKDTFTIAPVNKYGFPAGEGATEAEKSGPYSFVLATVRHVHFDEDDRYYTIMRADTGTEQRADSGWMEPIKSPLGIDAALRAAGQTVRSTQDKPIEKEEERNFVAVASDCLMDAISWPSDFAVNVLKPFYRQQRANAKQSVTMLLYGTSPFACKLRITGINILVGCSLIFLFLEVVNLGFFPARWHDEVAIVGAVVWAILALELIFEVLIRPRGYTELISSDRAFAPSTARHINRFHLFFEMLALLTFIPEFDCIRDVEQCSTNSDFTRIQLSIDAVTADSHTKAALGRFFLGLTALRFFAVVRHWKQMWISNAFRAFGWERWLLGQTDELADFDSVSPSDAQMKQVKKTDDDMGSHHGDKGEVGAAAQASSEEDLRLKRAATIGTALMVVNSHRALILLTFIVLVLPMINSMKPQNSVAANLANLLQANNMEAGEGDDDGCNYLQSAVESWLKMGLMDSGNPKVGPDDNPPFVLWAQIAPPRCNYNDGVITQCIENANLTEAYPDTCEVWDNPWKLGDPTNVTASYFAKALDIRIGGIREITVGDMDYSVTIMYNMNQTVALANRSLFLLLMGMLVLVLFLLTFLRSDAIRLVLDPLQRMLKIVLRYAENPLAQEQAEKKPKKSAKDRKGEDKETAEIGNYETEQLINAVAKIADLLRKCWGVAGAGIISSNLARTKDGKTVVFNPTVPGKRVYALFGFIAINGFSDQLRALDRDVMILINDVAKVVHDEVFRWALGDSGQCNKNLGAAFLMVFRIGDFSEVHDKEKRARTVVLGGGAKANVKQKSSLRRRNQGGSAGRQPYGRRRKGSGEDATLQLASLPGIQAFTDRALLGMLKSFAGLHRDRNLNVWKNDFRLSAGVQAYTVDILYGMDAGWAVEGAVGSEYKIDATYLSPHVNMASRMMSATKQYGVTILLSKAVEELLSRPCRKKLRHLDTVYVKGSKVKQDIFTFDARHKGVDFFLIERTPDQADVEAASYNPNIWDVDQDLRAMRQHVTHEFSEMFALGVKQYLIGNWPAAIESLERADNMMIETIVGDGFIDFNYDEVGDKLYDRHTKNEDIIRIRNEIGDGACRVLISYMERRKSKAPADWDAVRKLMSK